MRSAEKGGGGGGGRGRRIDSGWGPSAATFEPSI